ncbi:MAG: hypothetical protein HZA63_15110 [Rhodocyclales bacterium]|nr:hypothetical protein [Rhodocyclales bacterium]
MAVNSVRQYLASAVLTLTLLGCGKSEAPKPVESPETVKAVIVAQQKAEMADKQRQEAERLRKEAEIQKKAAEEAKAKSEYLTMGLIVLVVFALFVGIAIGSSSRKDAAKRNVDANRE